MPLQSDFGERTINELILMFKNRQINLEPGFQRNLVWTTRDRRRLIQSSPPATDPVHLLYMRQHNGRTIYDVIDGKQRLETVLMFAGQGRFKRQAFDVRLDLETEWIGIHGATFAKTSMKLATPLKPIKSQPLK